MSLSVERVVGATEGAVLEEAAAVHYCHVALGSSPVALRPGKHECTSSACSHEWHAS
jgi:hypothetical protein